MENCSKYDFPMQCYDELRVSVEIISTELRSICTQNHDESIASIVIEEKRLQAIQGNAAYSVLEISYSILVNWTCDKQSYAKYMAIEAIWKYMREIKTNELQMICVQTTDTKKYYEQSTIRTGSQIHEFAGWPNQACFLPWIYWHGENLIIA